MNFRTYLLLFLSGLILPITFAQFQPKPGYLDSEYYYAGGIQLATGKGFNEPYLWNYLDGTKSLPHPSHTYWFPLASIISAIPMWLLNNTSYAVARIPFIIIAALVVPITAHLAYLFSKLKDMAIISALFAIFSVYHAPFVGVTDNFSLFMLFGGLYFLAVTKLLQDDSQTRYWFVLGLLAGLLALSRSDGLLWLGLAGLVAIWKPAHENGTRNTFQEWLRLVIPAGLLALLGYLLTMGFWHVRNITLFDSFMTPGGGRLLWLQSYNETFIYPPEDITRERFLQGGWDLALQNRVRAFNSNLGNTFAAQGEIFLFPLMLIGLWQLRNDLRTRISVTGWLLLFAVMTIIFPFAGSRGSFFHAGAAFQPYWWVAAPIGTDVFVSWLQRRGQFTDKNAPYIFQGIIALLAVLMTAHLVNSRVIAGGWAKDDAVYASVEEKFLDNGISPMDVVIVRNPPGYFIGSGRPAIALPFGDEETILQVAEKFGAGYLVLEKGGTFGAIRDLYDDPQSHPAFVYLGEVDEAKLYRIELEP